MKKNKITRICFTLLICASLIFSNMAYFTNIFAYADSVSEYIEKAELFSPKGTIGLDLATSMEDAGEYLSPDINTLQVRVYPTEAGKTTKYYCKLWHYDTTKNAWTTENAWNMPLKGGKVNYASLTFIGTRAKYVAVGEKHQFKLELNDKKTNGETIETYYFNLIRSVGLSDVTATNADGQSLVVTAQTDYKYVIACPYDTLNLTCTAKTPSYAKIQVNGTEVESGAAYSVDLTKYEENADRQKEIPVSVIYTGNEGTGQGTEYTLIVEKLDYTPQVTTSYDGAIPEDEDVGFYNANKKLSCEKDAAVTMSVTATAPEGSSLTYQWYLTDKSGDDHRTLPIEGAVHPSYTVPTNYAKETVYSCIVTNTVGSATFATESERCLVVVKPTYASMPVIKAQPEKVELLCGQTGQQTAIEAVSYDVGASLSYQWYKSTENSNQNGTKITDGDQESVTIDTTEVGTYYYYCEVKSSLTKEAGKIVVSEATVSDPIQVVIKNPAEYFDGKGTKDEPFLIKTADDFETIRSLVAGGNSFAETYFKMDCENKELTLPDDWTPIGTLKDGFTETELGVGVLPFSGNLDGDGCKLIIPYNGKPLFCYVRDASVSNLKIYGENINGAGLVDKYFIDYGLDGNYSTGVPDTVTIENVTLLSGSSTKKSGFIHGNASGKNNIVITNSTVEENVTIGYDKNESAIGSFAGCLNGTIINCKSAAEVYGISSVGGIAGEKGQSMGVCSVLNCQFTGEIHATGNYAGGMIGSGYDGKGTAPNTPVVTIRNCLVSGIIEGKSNLGGILGGEPGCENCWANGSGSVIDNVFCGRILGTDTNAVVGAIVGFMKSYNTNQTVDSNYFTESCGAANGIGGVEIILDDNFDIAKTGSAVSEQAMKDSTVVDKLNKSSTSYKNWIQGTDYPVHSDEPVVYAIEISGDYKKEYKTGDAFSTEGMVITGKVSDGSTQSISLSDPKLEFSGFQSDKRGVQTITVSYGVASTTYDVTVLYNDSEVKKIVAYFTLLGDSSHGEPTEESGTHTLSAGNLTTWIPTTKVNITNNTTVYDVLKQVLQENGITWEESYNLGTAYIESLTRNDITLGEFTNGQKSGWMYTLNGIHSNLGVAQQFLDNGDRIVFHYTDDYTVEEGSDKRDTLESVEEKINAIGTVTIHSCSKIKAARTAYDALTDEEKQYVDNYDTLTAAESKIADLYIEAAKADHKAIYEATGKYIKTLGTPSVGSVGGEWMVIDLTRAGYDCPEGYYQNVVDYVKAKINDKEQLHRAKSTDNSRVILALTAAGYDVTDVDGHNLLMGLTDMEYVKKQGINGPIWALIAFDCYKYDIPDNPSASDQVTREKLIAYILEKQLEDGGWALSGKAADPDMTGMAIQALAPYYNTNAKVKAAVDKALDCLSALQYDNGGFGSIDGTCSESCAQVIVALTALGINPETDARFVKNGVSVVDAMCLFAIDGGGFAHIPDGGLNGMATEQSQYALASYFRLLEGKTSLYDMTDVVLLKDAAAAEAVEKLISDIGTVTADSAEAIEKARYAYNALTDTQKALVDNYSTLTAAEKTFRELSKNVDSPKTGDNSNISLYFIVMIVSAFCLIAVLFTNKKRKIKTVEKGL